MQTEEKILEHLVREKPFTYYVIDEKGLINAKGTVHERNLDFEMGIGQLYEMLGQLNPEVIAAHKKEMNPEYVFFVDEDNKKDWLSGFNTRCAGWSETLKGIEKYL